MAWITREAFFNLQVIYGLFNLVLNLVTIYFACRWGVTLLATDEQTRKMLMGDQMASVFNRGDLVVTVFAAVFLGYKVVSILVTTAQWEIRMQHERQLVVRKRVSIRLVCSLVISLLDASRAPWSWVDRRAPPPLTTSVRS